MLLALIAACGDDATPDAGLDPAPDTVTGGNVTVHTDPLRLVVDAPGGAFEVDRFVEVAVANRFDDTEYYDPRDPDPGQDLTWTAATRAEGVDDTGALVLDSGVTLAVTDAGALRVDAGGVADAVLVRLVLPRDDGEAIFGFGESFESPVADGSVREMQMRVDFDSESSLNEAHVPVPLSLWPARGVGVFVEDPRPGAFDVGAQRADRVLATFTLAEPGPLTAHVFTADEPLALVRRYVALTAPPALPPIWALSPQQWRNAHDNRDQMLDDAHQMRDLNIPGSVMWIDNPWQTAYNDFVIDEARFAESEAMIAEVQSLGYHVMVWSTPYVNRSGPTSPDFDEAAQMGFLVTDGAGKPLVYPWQDGPGALVDFTRDGATAWWRERIARITDLGIVGFKLDFGEDVVPEIAGVLTPFELAAGNAQTMHNAYAYGYHDAYLGALPAGDGFLITRAGSYGEQAVNTAIWPGDLDSDFSRHGTRNDDDTLNVGGLPSAVAAGLSLSASGYPFFGSDIGGFREGLPTTECLVRWAEYAALGTIMQLGGGGPSHNPWDDSLFDAAVALPIYRRYARLHMDLIPYLYSLAVVAATDGTPVTIPTRLVHPQAASDDATFFVGDALFVAPVIEQGATTRDVVLPPGTWVDFWTGERVEGNGTTARTVDAPLDTLPLWRRVDALLPMYAVEADTLAPATDGAVRSYLEPAFGRELRLLVTPELGGTRVSLYDGTTATSNMDGDAHVVDVTAGDEFDIFTLDVRATGALDAIASVTAGGVALAEADDEAALMGCAAPGCYLLEPASRRLRVRVHGSTVVRWQR